MLKSVAGRQAFNIKRLPKPNFTRLSRRVGLRTIGSISGKTVAALPPGTYLSTAATSTDATNFPLTRGGALRRGFWHDGYAYIFFADTSYGVIYNSTLDGTTWAKPATGNPVVTRTERGSVDVAYNIDVLYDGSNVYVAVVEMTDEGVVKIRKGTLSNGEITWGSWVTVASGTSGEESVFVSLCQTDDGYFWVAYTRMPATNYFDVYCVKSSSINSIDSWGSSVLVYDETSWAGFKNCAVLQVSANSVYMVYIRNYNLYGKTFDGTNVGSEELITSVKVNNDRAWAACSDSVYNICILSQRYTDDKIILRRRVDGSWQSEVETPITPAPCGYNGFSLTADTSTSIYIFYNEEVSDPYFKFYYRTWNPTDGFGAAVSLTNNEQITSNYNQEVCSNNKLQTTTLIGIWFRTYPGPAYPLRCVIVSGLS